PTRLLDLTVGKDAHMIQLVETSSMPYTPSLRYITVSHCWGGKQILRLLRSNIGSFKRGIPLTQLPKTFRDAVEIC
ncbi:hypothetical protein M501DRAFT_922980, partial [Patellaria atrata CBS 101060]